MNYAEQLDALKAGSIETIEVTVTEFFAFREAWSVREDKKQFVGEAHHGGSVTYRYVEEENTHE